MLGRREDLGDEGGRALKNVFVMYEEKYHEG
jgi:hypothetical protein